MLLLDLINLLLVFLLPCVLCAPIGVCLRRHNSYQAPRTKPNPLFTSVLPTPRTTPPDTTLVLESHLSYSAPSQARAPPSEHSARHAHDSGKRVTWCSSRCSLFMCFQQLASFGGVFLVACICVTQVVSAGCLLLVGEIKVVLFTLGTSNWFI